MHRQRELNHSRLVEEYIMTDNVFVQFSNLGEETCQHFGNVVENIEVNLGHEGDIG